jgi:hypothetical protein
MLARVIKALAASSTLPEEHARSVEAPCQVGMQPSPTAIIYPVAEVSSHPANSDVCEMTNSGSENKDDDKKKEPTIDERIAELEKDIAEREEDWKAADAAAAAVLAEEASSADGATGASIVNGVKWVAKVRQDHGGRGGGGGRVPLVRRLCCPCHKTTSSTASVANGSLAAPISFGLCIGPYEGLTPG